MIDYDKLLEELREEKAACQYAYGEMVPAFLHAGPPQGH